MPSRGTTNDVGGIISANNRKNTVRDNRIEIDRDTWRQKFGLKMGGQAQLRFHTVSLHKISTYKQNFVNKRMLLILEIIFSKKGLVRGHFLEKFKAHRIQYERTILSKLSF